MAGVSVNAKACNVCHGAGIAGAPVTGDAGAWTDRIAQGMSTLNKHAIEGYVGKNGVMPAKGGNMALSDDEVANAVAFMVESSQ